MRTFSGGATRDNDDSKPEFASILSPVVLRRFGEYMIRHNVQADGKKRGMANWKTGMPRKVYLESMFRHFVDVWEIVTRDHQWAITPGDDKLEEALCAMLFNNQGLLREVLLGRDIKEEDHGT